MVYRSFDGENAVISGGVRLSYADFTPIDSGEAEKLYDKSAADKIVKIDFPKKIEMITEYSFSYCDALKKLNFKSPIKIIGNRDVAKNTGWVFLELKGLEEINLRNNSMIVNAFDRCEKIKKIKIPKKSVVANSFNFCSGLKKVILGKKVRIASEAEMSMESAYEGSSAFVYCHEQMTIYVSENNQIYKQLFAFNNVRFSPTVLVGYILISLVMIVIVIAAIIVCKKKLVKNKT